MRATVDDRQQIAEAEREACARIAEGRFIWHKHSRKHVQAEEARAIAAAIRDRNVYGETASPGFAKAGRRRA